MDKFTKVDNSTIVASSSEKERIFQSFVKRVTDYEEVSGTNFSYQLIFNPSRTELQESQKLKDGIYFSSDDYTHQFDAAIKSLRGKLTLFRFDTRGINNLLFFIKTKNATSQTETNKLPTSEVSLFSHRIDHLFFESLVSDKNVCICLIGNRISGTDDYLQALSYRLNRNIVYLSLNSILKDNSILKKSIAKEQNSILYLGSLDFLFSDINSQPNIPNRELSMLRQSLLDAIINNTSNTVVINVSSPQLIPFEISSWIKLIEDISDYPIDDVYSVVTKYLPNGQYNIDELVNILVTFPAAILAKELGVIKRYLETEPQFDVIKYAKDRSVLYRRTRSGFNKVEGADFKISLPSTTLDRVVLSKTNREKLNMALSSIIHQDLIYNTWGWREIDPNVRSIINFFGPPGTGKTMCANAIANELSKQTGEQYQLLSLNYSEIESMYVGEAPKKLERVFNYARDKKLVLFFDEADSFLGKRIQNVSQGAEQAINSLRSTMLIQLEKYTGIVIFATNLTTNYDPAFKTRFLAEIEFPLPDKATCIQIFINNMPQKIFDKSVFNEVQLNRIGDALMSLSGRDIKTIIWRVLLSASLEDIASQHVFNVEEFIAETEKYKNEKKATVTTPLELTNVSTNVTPASQEIARRLGMSSEQNKDNGK